MTVSTLDELAVLITRERDALLSTWRGQVRQLPSARHLDGPTLNDHIPDLIDELIAALRAQDEGTIPDDLRVGSPPAHGLQRVQDGFDIEEVVAEYNILRGCIHDLADHNGLSMQGQPFRIINRVLNKSIGLAVQTYASQRALDVQHRREEYLAFVTHDLRTPLNAVSLTARVLEREHAKHSNSEESARMWKALHRNVQHLEGLVRKILDEQANLQTEVGVKLQMRTFDLWPLVESLTHDLHPVAGTASTQLINEVPDDLMVYADASLLRRVVQNLIANAIKYTPRGVVTIGAIELDRNGAVACWVSDNGAGIPEDLRGKVFDKGETDPDSVGGSGLGLAIVKTFIEAHGGTVTVESMEGVGSTFRFSLPGRAESSL